MDFVFVQDQNLNLVEVCMVSAFPWITNMEKGNNYFCKIQILAVFSLETWTLCHLYFQQVIFWLTLQRVGSQVVLAAGDLRFMVFLLKYKPETDDGHRVYFNKFMFEHITWNIWNKFTTSGQDEEGGSTPGCWVLLKTKTSSQSPFKPFTPKFFQKARYLQINIS